MIKHMCHWVGCSRAAEGYYCEVHKDKAKKETRLFEGTRRGVSATWQHLYNTPHWKKMRKEFLAAHPLCAMCGKPANVADHITPHRGAEALFYNEANLQALCHSCHSRKTLAENNNFNRRKG